MEQRVENQKGFTQFLNDFIDFISFDDTVIAVVDKLNQSFEDPIVKPLTIPHSHPGGFRREFGKRRLNIAEAYLLIAKTQAPELYKQRLDALQTVIEQSLHAKSVAMPINTARMQMFMIKNAIEVYGNKRLQLEFISDFSKVSFGNEVVIRKFLKKYGLIEVPEEEKSLKQMSLGWDDHVRDSLSDGRKAPSQLMIDAFIKGLSRITIVYNNLDEPRIISEAMMAGEIMGIAVEIGMEFTVGSGKNRRRYAYIPPVFAKSKDFFSFLKEKDEQLKDFREGLRENMVSRRQGIIKLINQFNELHLPKLNEGFSSDSTCWFAPLQEEELDKIVGYGQPSTEHLSELLFDRFKKVYHKRVLYLKALTRTGKKKLRQKKEYTRWNYDYIKNWYEECRKIYVNLEQEDINAKYMSFGQVIVYDSAFNTEEQVFEMLSGLPGKIVFLNPLEAGLKKAVKHILKYVQPLTNVELMNLKSCAVCNPNDILILNKFLYLLNNRSSGDLIRFLENHEIEYNKEDIESASKICNEKPISPNCGSGATGRSHLIPGMGFIRSNRLLPSVRKDVFTKHVILPRPIGTMILNRGKWPHELNSSDENLETLVALGTKDSQITNKVGDESKGDLNRLNKLWQYLNPKVKNFVLLALGFAFTMHWMHCFQFKNAFQVALIYTLVWLFITYFRNVLVDLIASAGTDFKQWTAKNINFENAYQSLFWTGVSVPVLGIVKNHYDLIWTGAHEGYLFEGVKFLALSLANGFYIAAHNKLRAFDSRVIKVNFFRSILSWPFATVFAPVLNIFAIPSIVQAKIWADFTGGFIEGAAKFSQRFRLRKRDLISIMPKLNSKDKNEVTMAMLDILYIWAKAPRGKTCLKLLLLNKPSLGERIWKKKASSDERKIRRIRSKKEYDRIKNLFEAEGAVDNLLEYALRHYSLSDAIKLTNLVGNEVGHFVDWLDKLKGHFAKVNSLEIVNSLETANNLDKKSEKTQKEETKK